MPYSSEGDSSRGSLHFVVRNDYSTNPKGVLGRVRIPWDMTVWYGNLQGLTEDLEVRLNLDDLDPMIWDSTVWRRYFTLVLDRTKKVVLLREKYKGALPNYKEYMRSPAEEEEQMDPEEILRSLAEEEGKGVQPTPENLYDLTISLRGLRVDEIVRRIKEVNLDNGDSFNIYNHEED